MKCFVTGASGFIGYELTSELIRQNHQVNVLIRRQFNGIISEKLKVFNGDLHDRAAIESGMKGCDWVFHLAAYAQLWSRDKSIPYKTNYEGTKNILESALKNKVKRLVFISSAGVLAPSEKDVPVDENTPLPEEYLTIYEITKFKAEELCLEYVEKGLDIVILRPSRVFGPGFLNKSNSVTILIQKYLKGNWRFIPGNGKSVGNYVFIKDVVHGIIEAADKGIKGERYILGGHNLSFIEFFEAIRKVSGKQYKLFKIPKALMFMIAHASLFIATVFNIAPLITPVWLTRYLQNRALSSAKAEKHFHYHITSIEDSLKQTITWLKSIE